MEMKDVIIRQRKKLLMTQQELADAMGVKRGTVAHWETGSTMTIENAQKLAQTLNITMDQLIFPDGRPEK